ncbi:MAG: hypothetical protein NTX07_00070 [Solirubrobacterales bacterium]|nr:hypothetical protein [Solirubrobacterales bacterium]
MPNKTTFAVVLSLSAVAFTTACGSSSTPESQISSTFSGATAALADGDGAKFCDALTPSAQKSFGSQISSATGASDCKTGVTNLMNATKALSSGDWKTFCKSIGPKAAAQIAGAGAKLKTDNTCEAAGTALSKTPQGKAAFDSLGKQLDASLGRLKNGKLVKIKVNGNTATASVTPLQPNDKPVKFEKVNGTWKISQ